MTGPSTPATTASAAPAPRRSGRERKKAESIYADAEKEVELLRLRSASPKKRTPRAEDEDENMDDGGESPSEDERSAASTDDESSDESDDDDDDDFGGGKAAPKGAAAKRKGAGQRAKKTRISTGRSPVAPSAGRRAPRGGRRAAAGTAARRAKHQSLATLARHVLPPGETPGLSSLIAGLLHSYRPAGDDVDLGDVPQTSEYTPNLVALARKVVAVHNDEPNKAQVALLNLLFRSVAGSEANDLSLGTSGRRNGQARGRGGGLSDSDEEEDEEEEKETILDEMDTDDWARVVTDLVDDLRHVPAARIPLCADPLGAVHQAHELAERERRVKEGGKSASNWVLDGEESRKQASAGAVEYRKIYVEFWRALGHVALTEGGMATAGTGGEFESQGSRSNSETPVVVRRDAELVKAVLLRVVELSPVGQPDVRAAATLAAFSIAHAVLDQSSLIMKKMDVAARQYAAAAKGGGEEGAKAEALKARTESLRRTVEDLEEVVLVPVVQGLFVHRYRDSNEHVRAMCLDSLSRFTLQRPDIFLTDKYLKYFGWMTHDKNPRVRLAAFRGLLRPFDAASDAAAGKERPVGDECLMVDKIDLGALENVVAKFLPRIADAVMDPAGEVQEAAMKLMLALLKNGFLDEVSEDKLWDQTNQRCLAEDAPATVQRDALYFILDQLEAFDEGGENEKVVPDERKRAQQLDAIASYAAHTLTNGPVPIDKIQVKVSDLLVKSLREMPEHRGLVTDWSAMLRAVKEDKAAATAHHVTAGDRANVAKQRVLVRMLACAARLEVGSVADAAFLHRGTDVDAVEMPAANSRPAGKGNKAHMGREHENLSIALLEALPNLLLQFKGDTAIIPELASLPHFLIPTVYSLPQRKKDYNNLIKALAEIYVSSSDDRILTSTACSLVSLCSGDHARVPESKAQLRKVVVELRDRIVELMSSDDSTIATSAVSVDPASSDFTSVRSKRRSSARKTPASSVRGQESPVSDKTSLTGERSDAHDADSEYAIFLNLKRLKILSKKCDLSVFFDDRNNVNQLELLCNFVSDGLKSRLRACKPVDMRTINPDEETTVHKVIDSPEVLAAIGKSVGEGLEFMLCVIAWFAHSVQEKENLVVEDDDLIDNSMEEDEDAEAVDDHVVIRLRSRLLSTLELCFAQYLLNADDRGDDETSVAQHSEAQHSFADFVQLAAGKVVSDIRTLLPKEYADAASPILRSFAAYQDGRLIGAAVRFLESKEQLLHENDGATSSAERKLSQALLYPMGRALATNWTNGNRREAGMFLRHIDASGPTAAAIVSETSRQMKKIDPVRMLESQMASLRQSYEIWVDDTPELVSDFPSEDEMAEFENTEKVHKEQFHKLEQRASQFSSVLGVFGRLSNKKLGPALGGFVREGIRFSFSNIDSSGEDSLVLGSRLSFLLILSKYANWTKKDRKHKAEIQDYIDGLETEMRDHEEFEEVHDDDLEALATFRSIVGLKPLPAPQSGASVMSSGVSVASASARSARSATRSVASAGASVMSGRSSRSVMSGVSAGAASAVSARSTVSARSGASAASARSGGVSVTGASVASSLSDNDNGADEDESLDGVSSLVSPAPSTGRRSAGSRASRTSRLSSALPTLPESSAEKEESPQDEGSESDTHFSESPGDSRGKKRSQSQMTYEHSSDDDSDGRNASPGSEVSSTKRRKT